MRSQWLNETLFFEGDAFFSNLVEGIASAKVSIDFETYIYQDDKIGRLFEAALTAAAARGVRVRLLVDGIGSSTWIERRSLAVDAKGVEVGIYHPVRFRNLLSFSQSTGLIYSKVNRRTHRKMCIIDDSRAWVGSMNIAGEHSRDVLGALSWRDTAVSIEGPEVAELTAAFASVWRRRHNVGGKRDWTETLKVRPRAQTPCELLRLNYKRRFRRANFRDLVRRISNAKDCVWITNAYFAPSRPLLKALRRAVKNGADVRILLPRNSDVFFMPWVATSYYPTLLKSGVRVYEFVPRFLHAKTLLIDHWSMVGTSNLNNRSLLHDFEVDVVLSANASIEAMEREFIHDLGEAEEMISVRGGWTAWLGRMFAVVLRNWI